MIPFLFASAIAVLPVPQAVSPSSDFNVLCHSRLDAKMVRLVPVTPSAGPNALLRPIGNLAMSRRRPAPTPEPGCGPTWVGNGASR